MYEPCKLSSTGLGNKELAHSSPPFVQFLQDLPKKTSQIPRDGRFNSVEPIAWRGAVTFSQSIRVQQDRQCCLYDAYGEIAARGYCEFTQQYPHPGWVEHDAAEIWEVTRNVITNLVNAHGVAQQIAAIGLANQRETTVVWNRSTGKPIHPAIVWQCRRTSGVCEELKARGGEDCVRAKTGLVLDAYFSATKVAWILDSVDGARERAERGELAFGTIDAWLLWNLTAGEVHATDYTNASRTMLFNIDALAWDDELLAEFRVPERVLPEVQPSASVLVKRRISTLYRTASRFPESPAINKPPYLDNSAHSRQWRKIRTAPVVF